MNATLEFDYDEEQVAIQAAIERFCAQRQVVQLARQPDQPFPRALWRELAALGAFLPAAPGHPDAGGALALCAIAEVLGRHLFPGPVAATAVAVQVLPQAHADNVLDGSALVALCSTGSTLLPYGPDADLFLAGDGHALASAHVTQPIAAVATLGGETWGRAALQLGAALPGAARAYAIGNIVSAAYLAAAGRQLLEAACSHAAIRRQFGKALGEFQAVAHPLADCAIALAVAGSLTRVAAAHFDCATAPHQMASAYAAAAQLSAQRASLHTASVCHQVFAATGITRDGPAFHFSRRIRQFASTPPAGGRQQEVLLAVFGLGSGSRP